MPDAAVEFAIQGTTVDEDVRLEQIEPMPTAELQRVGDTA
jgi:hypothetical protein